MGKDFYIISKSDLHHCIDFLYGYLDDIIAVYDFEDNRDRKRYFLSCFVELKNFILKLERLDNL